MDDFSLRAGHADGALMAKTLFIEDLALALKIPIVKLVDGSSGGGSVTTIAKSGWSYMPAIRNFNVVCKQLNAGIPNLGAVVGPLINWYLCFPSVDYYLMIHLLILCCFSFH